ncbi:hypothetical protein [Flavobacterium acetivorans]|uniref:hypothetical protein n=1 Tax=Flavobacterium acetivorans TaxID=2893883 RepID=UPI001E31C047|nr:hypothetical protein [Flavobacterium sp. F-29]UFH35022.1 hypothetical protein LNP19_13115 [Flavobacterium sp. F-29]
MARILDSEKAEIFGSLEAATSVFDIETTATFSGCFSAGISAVLTTGFIEISGIAAVLV